MAPGGARTSESFPPRPATLAPPPPPVDESNRDEMRAAIMLFISLGRVYVYDADKYEEHLELALLKARELLKHWIEGGWDNDQHIGENISHEIKILEMRKLGEAAYREPPEEELRSYWLRWM